MENRVAAVGSGAASLEGIRARAVDPFHLETMTQTQVFSGDETLDMVRRGANGGGHDFLTKPLGDDGMHNICRPVNERSLNATANAAPANIDPRSSQHGTSRKRPTEVDHSDEGFSGSRTAKKINFHWAAQKHALLHKVANNRLNGTEAHHTLNNSWKNYSTSQDSEGSSGFNMRSHGARNLNQISRLSGITSPVGLGVHGNGSSTKGLGGAAIRGPTSSTSNGNANGYGYQYGSGNANSYCNLNNNGYGYGYTDDNGGHGEVLADGIMASASLPSNLAQPVQQPVPTSNLFPSNTVRAMDNLNHIGKQELVPRLYRLSYDCKNGGISMSPWPQDDDTDLLRRYQGENVVMENTTTTDMTHEIQNAATMDKPQDIQNAATKEMLGDGPAGQTSAVQPQGLGGEFFNWASTTFETAGSSGGRVVTDETLDLLTPDEFENLMNPSRSESMEELVEANSK